MFIDCIERYFKSHEQLDSTLAVNNSIFSKHCFRRMKGVDRRIKVQGVDRRMKGVDGRTKGVDGRTKGVDRRMKV